MAERWRGRVALVTGASSGIGYSVAKALVERGMKVVGCARNIKTIQALAAELKGQPGSLTATARDLTKEHKVAKLERQPGFLMAIACDLSKEDEVKAMFQEIRRVLGRVDVCINNAGLAHKAPLLSGDYSDFRHMFEVNVLGLLMCTQESFKLMQENKIDDGHIILVNSLAGVRMVTQAGGHCYSATKFAVNAIREGLRQELREQKSHIRISQVCPGIVETQFHARMSGDQAAAEKIYSSRKYLKPDDIKDSILYILDAPPHVEINDVWVRSTEQSS